MSSATLYRARYLLPITSAPIEDGALLVADGTIRASGPYRELLRANPGVERVDFADNVILPPFVNAHTHLELSDFGAWAKAAAEPEPPVEFVDWILWLVRVKRTVTEAQLRSSLRRGLQASLAAGTGLVGDILTTPGAATIYAGSPLQGRIYHEVLGHDLLAVQARLEQIHGALEKGVSHGFDAGLSPHSSYTLSREVMRELASFAERTSLQSCIHLAESAQERRFLLDASGPVVEKLYRAAGWSADAAAVSGASPVETLCRAGLLQPGDLVVHGVEVDADDIRLLKEMNCSVALCPRSNASLGGGRAPLEEYLAAGVNLALGTDSLASSASLSIWDELAFAQQWFAGAASPGQWLQIATTGGRQALGHHTPTALFEHGADASFQVVSLADDPGRSALEEALCHAGAKARLDKLFLGGRNHLPKS